jgi:hypothetical protein
MIVIYHLTASNLYTSSAEMWPAAALSRPMMGHGFPVPGASQKLRDLHISGHCQLKQGLPAAFSHVSYIARSHGM